MAAKIYYNFENQDFTLKEFQIKHPNEKIHPGCSTAELLKDILDKCCDNKEIGHKESFARTFTLTGQPQIYFCCDNCQTNFNELVKKLQR